MAFALPVLGLVGAGISAYSSIAAGKAQQRISQFNFAVQQSNAKLQMMAQLGALQQQRNQSAVALRQAEINYQLANAEASAREANAKIIRQNADARTAASREEIRRKRLDFARFQAAQRARIAGSGVTEAGSPLELLAETAGQMQLAIEEMHQQANIDRATQYNEAEMESFGAKLMKAGNNSALSMAKAQNALSKNSFALSEATTRSQYRANLTEANINRMAGFADAKGKMLAGVGNLFSGLGSFAKTRSTFTYAGVS